MRFLRNRLWMLGRKTLRTSSTISDIHGLKDFRSTGGEGFTARYQNQFLPSGYPFGILFEFCSPKPPSIDHMTPNARRSVCRVSPAIVGVFFQQGNRILGKGTGTIIDPYGTIITTAHLMGSPESATALEEIVVTVIIEGGERLGSAIYKGVVLNADFNYDIAVIKIVPQHPLLIANLGTVEDVSLDDEVVSLGRIGDSYQDMHPQFLARKGNFIRDGVRFCRSGPHGELISVTCLNEEGCDGGPLVNCQGEVIGIMSNKTKNYCAISIDVVSKILVHFKQYGRVIQPYIGVAIAGVNEKIMPQIGGGDIPLPNVREGVMLSAVTPGSPADCAGLLPGDILIEFDGKNIGSFHEFFEIMWNNVGKPLKMVVRRSGDIYVTLTVVPDEASPDKYDRIQQTQQERKEYWLAQKFYFMLNFMFGWATRTIL